MNLMYFNFKKHQSDLYCKKIECEKLIFMSCKQLFQAIVSTQKNSHIFKLYNWVSVGICVDLWNYQHDKIGNRISTLLSNLPMLFCTGFWGSQQVPLVDSKAHNWLSVCILLEFYAWNYVLYMKKTHWWISK